MPPGSRGADSASGTVMTGRVRRMGGVVEAGGREKQATCAVLGGASEDEGGSILAGPPREIGKLPPVISFLRSSAHEGRENADGAGGEDQYRL